MKGDAKTEQHKNGVKVKINNQMNFAWSIGQGEWVTLPVHIKDCQSEYAHLNNTYYWYLAMENSS